MIVGNREFTNLPRKFNVTISGCMENCCHSETQDIALVPAYRELDGRQVNGFNVLVGGKQGSGGYRPALSLDAFVRPEDAARIGGEITRIFLNNLSEPFNLTNGPKGITTIDPIRIGPIDFADTSSVMGLAFSGTIKYYYFLLAVLLLVVVVNLRLQDSRIGRAWEAIREDEIAARAMGINTRNMKLLAFAMGASFGGVASVPRRRCGARLRLADTREWKNLRQGRSAD